MKMPKAERNGAEMEREGGIKTGDVVGSNDAGFVGFQVVLLWMDWVLCAFALQSFEERRRRKPLVSRVSIFWRRCSARQDWLPGPFQTTACRVTLSACDVDVRKCCAGIPD
jgi:hypothetical protein